MLSYQWIMLYNSTTQLKTKQISLSSPRHMFLLISEQVTLCFLNPSIKQMERAEQDHESWPSHSNVSALPTVPPGSLSSRLLKPPQVPRRECSTSPYSSFQCLLVFRLVNWCSFTSPCLNTSSTFSNCQVWHNLTPPLLEPFAPIPTRPRHPSGHAFVPFPLYSTTEQRKQAGEGISQHLLCILKMQRAGLGTPENAHSSTRQTLLHPS